ncbi:heparinase II/III domain-containing protein [Geminisphaera colitermitum]|uniref:heparinase II/III domain-containing protein n=1 Tax=Geminisphaera colitermitum TaxID=1148786 RepID=UPI000158CFD7|nr:heparinase II/III family protein [Geminisphaera colitermitum]
MTFLCFLAALGLFFAALPLPGVRAAVVENDAFAGEHSQRILMSDTRIACIRQLMTDDPLMAELLIKIREAAEVNLTLPPNTHLKPGARDMLGQSRAAASRIVTSAFVYLIDGDERHFEAARRDLLNVCAFPDWNPRHFLDTAEMGFGVAVGYSWLRQELSMEDRAVIRAALVRNLLSMAPVAYDRSGRGELKWRAFGARDTTLNNWNFVCNGGFVAAALALRDEEPELAALVLAGARESLPLAMAGYAPDGVWPEGPTYWNYGTSYLVDTLAMLAETPEGDAGVSKLPGFDRTLDYALQLFGPSGVSFNFADGGPIRDYESASPVLAWLARRFERPDALPEIRRRLQERLRALSPASDRNLRRGLGGRRLVFGAIFFPERTEAPATVVGDAMERLPLDAHFRGKGEFLVLRSGRSDTNALWVGLKGGTNAVPHSHLDLGSFVLDAGGVRWAVDLGPEEYGLPKYFDYREGGQRWQYYRLNNRSHNTLTVADGLQSPTATARIIQFESKPEGGMAEVDLTDVYPGKVKKMTRRVSMPERKAVMIEDRVEGLGAGQSLTWRMLTPAHITVSDDGHAAVLVLEGRKLRAELLAPAQASFSVESALPPTRAEKQNQGVSVLTVAFVPDSSDARLAVRFIPE